MKTDNFSIPFHAAVNFMHFPQFQKRKITIRTNKRGRIP
ncbi:hypothetical protein C943_00256 [Mariniradius saccharolyticus AK6]|uniref:Uncharacterized protein n=1 Tax=Mariniradius saccharolyticus AK6 TaxID=1239962 RepID=M7XDM8_9BACT|nr:hypothetical protein C943_00256 [Mariniradius saccharolyticus AK6]